MQIGIKNLGALPAIQGQWVETAFVWFVIPLVPVHSLLITPRGPVPLHWQAASVIAGYVRMAAVGLLVAGVVMVAWQPWNEPQGWRLLGAAVALWIWTVLGLGPDRVERARLTTLHAVTSLAIAPEYLEPAQRREVLLLLTRRKDALVASAGSLHQLTGNREAMGLAYAWARYAQVEEPGATRQDLARTCELALFGTLRPGSRLPAMLVGLLALALLVPWSDVHHTIRQPAAASPNGLADIQACQAAVSHADACLRQGDVQAAAADWQAVRTYFKPHLGLEREAGLELSEWGEHFRSTLTATILEVLPAMAGRVVEGEANADLGPLLTAFTDTHLTHLWVDACGRSSAGGPGAVLVRLTMPADQDLGLDWEGMRKGLLGALRADLKGQQLQVVDPESCIGVASYASEIVVVVSSTNAVFKDASSIPQAMELEICGRSHAGTSSWDGVRRFAHHHDTQDVYAGSQDFYRDRQRIFGELSEQLLADLRGLPAYVLTPPATALVPAGAPPTSPPSSVEVRISADIQADDRRIFTLAIASHAVDGLTEWRGGAVVLSGPIAATATVPSSPAAAPAATSTTISTTTSTTTSTAGILLQLKAHYVRYQGDGASGGAASGIADGLVTVPRALSVQLSVPPAGAALGSLQPPEHHRISVAIKLPSDMSLGWDLIALRIRSWHELLFQLQDRLARGAWDPPGAEPATAASPTQTAPAQTVPAPAPDAAPTP